MNKINKTAIISTLFLIIGLSLVFYGMFGIEFDIKRLGTKEETKEYFQEVETSEIKNLKIDVDFGIVNMTSSAEVENFEIKTITNISSKFKIECQDQELIISDNKHNIIENWWNMFENYNRRFELNILYPADFVFENVDLYVSAGKVNCEGLTFNTMKSNISAGLLTLSNLHGQSFASKNSAGETRMENSDIRKINTTASAGNIQFKNIFFEEFDFKLSAGNLYVSVNGSKSEYNIDVDVSAGNSNLSNQKGTTEKYIKGNVSAGNINFSFND